MSVFINENYRAGFLLTAVVVCLETCEGRGLESGSKWICGIFSSWTAAGRMRCVSAPSPSFKVKEAAESTYFFTCLKAPPAEWEVRDRDDAFSPGKFQENNCSHGRSREITRRRFAEAGSADYWNQSVCWCHRCGNNMSGNRGTKCFLSHAHTLPGWWRCSVWRHTHTLTHHELPKSSFLAPSLRVTSGLVR